MSFTVKNEDKIGTTREYPPLRKVVATDIAGCQRLKILSLQRPVRLNSVFLFLVVALQTALRKVGDCVIRRCDEIYLEVRVSNTGAIKMYERLAFEIKSRLRSYYRDGEDAYLMALELS